MPETNIQDGDENPKNADIPPFLLDATKITFKAYQILNLMISESGNLESNGPISTRDASEIMIVLSSIHEGDSGNGSNLSLQHHPIFLIGLEGVDSMGKPTSGYSVLIGFHSENRNSQTIIEVQYPKGSTNPKVLKDELEKDPRRIIKELFTFKNPKVAKLFDLESEARRISQSDNLLDISSLRDVVKQLFPSISPSLFQYKAESMQNQLVFLRTFKPNSEQVVDLGTTDKFNPFKAD